MLSSTTKGYFYGIIASASYGTNPLFALPLYSDGMDTDSVLFWRYLMALPMLAVMIKVRGQQIRVPLKTLFPLFLMGLMMALSSEGLYASYRYMDASIASTLLFVYPLMVALMMAVFFKERMPLSTYICLAVALLGIGLLYKASDGATLSLLGTVAVMISALSYAIYIIGVNRHPLKDTPTLTVTFYVMFFGVLIFASRLWSIGGVAMPQHWYLWGNLLALALISGLISFTCTTLAVQLIGSTPTAILGVLEPVTAIFFGVVVFHEQLTGRDVLGIVCIIVAVTWVIASGKIDSFLIRFRKLFPKFFRH